MFFIILADDVKELSMEILSLIMLLFVRSVRKHTLCLICLFNLNLQHTIYDDLISCHMMIRQFATLQEKVLKSADYMNELIQVRSMLISQTVQQVDTTEPQRHFDFDVLNEFVNLGGMNSAGSVFNSSLIVNPSTSFFQSLASFQISNPKVLFEVLSRISGEGFKRDGDKISQLERWFSKQIKQRYEFIDSNYPTLTEKEEAGKTTLTTIIS